MANLPETRYTLLARLSDPNDFTAWSEFVQIYEDAIYRYSRSRGLQDSEAREVVQHVLMVVHRAVARWRPSGRSGSFRRWLFQTARRVCLRTLRDRLQPDRALGGSSVVKRLVAVAAADGNRDTDELDWQRWAVCWAAGEIEREIEPRTWRAFWLTAVEGTDPAVAANQLGMKVGAVYAAKCRVLARIRQRVQDFSRRSK